MNLFIGYLREILSLVWYVLSSILGVFIQLSDSYNREEKRTVLIVTGIGSQPLAFIFLKRFLEQKGYAVSFFRISLWETLGFGNKNIDGIAQAIHRYIREKNLRDINLLGISAGAVACLFYLEQYEGWEGVKHFISLSGAFKGGWVSYFFPFSHESHKFRPGGSIDKKISQLKLKHPEKITSLYGKWDEFVSPRSSQLSGVTCTEIPDGGHAYLQTFSKKTFNAIAHAAQK